jgi:hypothetical protein
MALRMGAQATIGRKSWCAGTSAIIFALAFSASETYARTQRRVQWRGLARPSAH